MKKIIILIMAIVLMFPAFSLGKRSKQEDRKHNKEIHDARYKNYEEKGHFSWKQWNRYRKNKFRHDRHNFRHRKYVNRQQYHERQEVPENHHRHNGIYFHDGNFLYFGFCNDGGCFKFRIGD